MQVAQHVCRVETTQTFGPSYMVVPSTLASPSGDESGHCPIQCHTSAGSVMQKVAELRGFEQNSRQQ